MRLKKMILAGLLLILIISIAGCSILKTTIKIHPIEKSDIFNIPAGTQCGKIMTEKNGYFISEYYFSGIVRARLEK